VLPGKQYSPEDLLGLLWRYRWFIILPMIATTILAAGVAYKLPNKYRSETLVLVVPQRIPGEYVRTTVTTRIENQVLTIREQILSRSRLERIVEELNLYPEERRKWPMEMVIDRMRRAVDTDIVRKDAFTVSFIAYDPEVAQRVTERLAGMFNEENMRDREVVAESTNQFLQTQLDDARRRLTEHERRVENFRMRHSGELPEQVTGNLQAIQNIEMQVHTLTQSIESDRDRKLLMERQIADIVNTPEAALVLPVTAANPAAPMSTTQQLEAAEATVRALEARVTSEHPDLVRARAAVDKLRRQLQSEPAPRGPNADLPRPTSAAEIARRNRLSELRAQLEAVDRQIASKTEEERRLRTTVAGYRARVEAAPTRETELVSLTRDYETLQRQYRSLLEKAEESKVAANLERRQIGEQFRILDPARVPERPFTPNRPIITAVGAAAGLVLGLALAGAIEFRNKSVRSVSDVILVCGVPVLATLPALASEAAGQRRKTRLLVWLGAGTTTGVALLLGFLALKGKL
jgi:polysaccharide chain length determinant protein (PEP-CTERM system associated)